MEKTNKTTTTYHDEVNKKNILHLRELLDTLPPLLRTIFQRYAGVYIKQDTRRLCL